MRFQSLNEMKYDSVLFNQHEGYFDFIKYSKWHNSKWKNLVLMKDPMALSIYLQLIQDLKPKTILEFGTYEGGSALWFHDMMVSLHLKCEVHTFDNNTENVKLPKHCNVNFHELNNYEIESFVEKNIDLFHSLAHPILVIEDSHVNINELLSSVDRFLKDGDYLVIEDTIDKSKYDCMASFLVNRSYLVDSYYCHFWGYNNSWNLNSFLKKNLQYLTGAFALHLHHTTIV